MTLRPFPLLNFVVKKDTGLIGSWIYIFLSGISNAVSISWFTGFRWHSKMQSLKFKYTHKYHSCNSTSLICHHQMRPLSDLPHHVSGSTLSSRFSTNSYFRLQILTRCCLVLHHQLHNEYTFDACHFAKAEGLWISLQDREWQAVCLFIYLFLRLLLYTLKRQ